MKKDVYNSDFRLSMFTRTECFIYKEQNLSEVQPSLFLLPRMEQYFVLLVLFKQGL